MTSSVTTRPAGPLRRATSRLLAVGTTLALLPLLVVGPGAVSAPAAALGDGQALTPPMGWNTYYGLGGVRQKITEAQVRDVADAMVERGLVDAGYDIVWVDGGWFSGQRASDGEMVADTERFPSGMAALAEYIHARGMRAGIYTDAGTDGCGGPDLGSFGHYQQDANSFAAWGYDAVKIDYCGGNRQGLDPETAYTEFSEAIQNNSSDRPMLINLCNPGKGRFNTWSFAPPIGHSWRSDGDIGTFRNIPWSRVMRNLDSNDAHPEVAGPGGWNDPDYLGPELGMTSTESRTQFLMWSLVAAPLIIGSDVRALSQESIDLLTNPEVLAVNQDPAGDQGTLVRGDAETKQVWVKDMADGSKAVALLNRGNAAASISTTASEVGLGDTPVYSLRDVVEHRTTATRAVIHATVPAHGTVLYRVTAERHVDPAVEPAVSVTPPESIRFGSGLSVVQPGMPNTVTATVTNDAVAAVRDVRLALDVPEGWTVEPRTVSTPALPPRKSFTGEWVVTPPAEAGETAAVTAVAEYVWGDGRPGSSAGANEYTVTTLSAPDGSTALSDLDWVAASSGFASVLRDRTYFGTPLTLDGVEYAKGLWMNAEASVDYYLGDRCDRLTADLGIDDSVKKQGSVVYEIFADGDLLFRSDVISRDTPTIPVDLDVTDVRALWIHVTDAGDGPQFDNADVAGAQLTCAG